MFDIIVGRNKKKTELYGTKGTIFIGKQYVKMGQVYSLSNNVYLDVADTHAIFICGKRGSGKSYTMGVIAEGISALPAEIREKISVVILDTMGIYWSMKYPNKKDSKLLDSWGIEPKRLDVKIFVPTGFFNDLKKKDLPVDYPFSLNAQDLSAEDWLNVFDIDLNTEVGAFIEKVINDIKDTFETYDLEDIIKFIQRYDYSTEIKLIASNRFENAMHWGLFSSEGTKLEQIIKPGQVSVIDVSTYAALAGAENVKALAIGLLAQKAFELRMKYRKEEEFSELNAKVNFFTKESEKELKVPLVWFIIDEAHEFLPREGKTGASKALKTILREGRQPGISLVLATQQPGKIHQDVLTQSDIVISHRLTAKIDVDALGLLMQSYMREGLDKAIDNLPREKGSAIVFDDNNERLFPIRIRPRFTWHGGSTASVLEEGEE
ncbi:MAG: hypothetical protein PWR32_594 [Candidatus Woesearchaeota archaeon]|nr:hypothetical protein [Candidatus Woesearchaeota archaeon]